VSYEENLAEPEDAIFSKKKLGRREVRGRDAFSGGLGDEQPAGHNTRRSKDCKKTCAVQWEAEALIRWEPKRGKTTLGKRPSIPNRRRDRSTRCCYKQGVGARCTPTKSSAQAILGRRERQLSPSGDKQINA